MTQSDSIAGAFAGAFANGPADLTNPKNSLDHHQQMGRLFDQACWLGKCAGLVYPEEYDEKESKEDRKKRVEALMPPWRANPHWEEFFKAIAEQKKQAEAGGLSVRALDTVRRVFSAEAWKNMTDGLSENDVDAIADRLHRVYRKCVRQKYLFPWRWLSDQRLKNIDQAKQRWSVAHELWVQKARTRIAGDNAEDSLPNVKVQFVSKGGIEYFLAGDEKLIILCFRGTEANKFGDVLTDLFAWQTTESDGKAKLHDGFWTGLDGVWDELKKSLEADPLNENGFRNTKQPELQKVWITGHSLGGALATLAAYRLVRREVLKPEQIGGVFTFGQPRVGDGQFAREYKDVKYKDVKHEDAYLNDHHFRFVNNNDVVTTVPPKSLWIFSVLLQPLLSWSSGSAKGDKKGGEDLDRSFEYKDVGRVVLANRSDRFKLLTPDHSLGWRFWKLDFWWPIRRWSGRFGSRLRATFMPRGFGGFIHRFLPGITDHSMTAYNRVLELESCALCVRAGCRSGDEEVAA